MITRIKEAIKKDHLLESGERVVLAVSGGADSVALLKVLDMLSDEYKLSLIVAHINHGLRENSTRDEVFVRRMAEEMGLPFECKSVDVRMMKVGTGRCTEEISRDVRYDFLNTVARTYNAQKIALGHNSDDHIETVLMNFLRGSGPAGLKGMLPARESVYIRPLLSVTRKEIISFLESHGVPFVTDESNSAPAYLRNRIRLSLIPKLKEQYNPRLQDCLKSMAEIMRMEDDYMQKVAGKILSDTCITDSRSEVSISIPHLLKHHPAIQRRVMKYLLERLANNSRRISHTHVEAALGLASSNRPGAYVNLPCNIEVRREYDVLTVFREGKKEEETKENTCYDFQYDVIVPGSVKMKELDRTMAFELIKRPGDIKSDMRKIAFMDYDMISPPLVIRTVRPGDRIQPLGMKGTKKIKSVFSDEKVPLRLRKTIPLLLDREAVLWIAGLQLSERVRITEKTRHILKVEFCLK